MKTEYQMEYLAKLAQAFPQAQNIEPYLNNTELNMGQLLTMIRAKYLIDANGYNSVKGKPFTSNELLTAIKKYLKD